MTDDQHVIAQRTVAVVARAMETFRNARNALGWLLDPNGALGGRAPIDLIEDSEDGAEEVCRILGRIDHGIYT
jgi:putative toxin-antitoxin system antitoxin component (TIGR02293 family)